MRDIDEMDVFFYFRVAAHKARGGRAALKTDDQGRHFIDQVWPTK